MRLSLTIACLGAAAALSACSSSHHPAAVSTTTTSTTVAPTTTSSSSTTTSSSVTTTSSTTAPPGPPVCATSQLTGSLASPNGTAGTTYYYLVLRNTGTATCTVDGYPGVSFVLSQGGAQVGASATRNPGTVATLQIPAGGSAKAELGITDAANYGTACGITPVNFLQVYPPGQTGALYVAHQDKACSNKNDVTLHVGPLVPGP
jgi:hypothetical protein